MGLARLLFGLCIGVLGLTAIFIVEFTSPSETANNVLLISKLFFGLFTVFYTLRLGESHYNHYGGKWASVLLLIILVGCYFSNYYTLDLNEALAQQFVALRCLIWISLLFGVWYAFDNKRKKLKQEVHCELK